MVLGAAAGGSGGADVPRQDYRQHRRCLLGSLARSRLTAGGGGRHSQRPGVDGISFTVHPWARDSHRIQILRSGLSKRHSTPSHEASAALQLRFAGLAADLRRSTASRAHAALRMPFNLKLHLPPTSPRAVLRVLVLPPQRGRAPAMTRLVGVASFHQQPPPPPPPSGGAFPRAEAYSE